MENGTDRMETVLQDVKEKSDLAENSETEMELEEALEEFSNAIDSSIEMLTEIPEHEDEAFKAVRFNDLTMIVRRLNEGFHVNSPHVEHDGDKVFTVKDWTRMVRQLRLKEYTLLHVAVIHSEIKVIRFLLSRGANVNAVDVNLISPLALAAAIQRPIVVKLLLKHGADPNIQSVSGRTPLIQAVGNNNFDIVEQLVKAGADLDLADTKGTTPLFTCFTITRDFDDRITQALIKGGCQIDYQNKQGATPLMMAAGLGRKDIAEMLLQAGADINHTDKAGKNVFHMAQGQKTALFLINHGASSDTRDKNGKRPLDHAARVGHIPMLRLLLSSDCERSTTILDVPRVEQARCQVPVFNVWLQHELGNPRDLKRLCRQTIRSAMSPLNTKYINSLPLPQLLKDFLLAKRIDLSF
ncbi:ankyrin repeat domain-containing protein 65 [Aplysia californica]|uniref:Ankyrin repeat domain-containing protein 65 n=1 Tax=Aplysia californica TaxID=6500 RepID=A0ABM0K2Y7_APLCA|nr:ankyrin repeat domain-containing protein 65 [Aplysia californica]XP_035828087.1 ankyrin repeat domain-containing protein 65 [Aplysia californica]XP_035828088.1 ankyrin repeat domain-containing protein 65 [Aplysia californica]